MLQRFALPLYGLTLCAVLAIYPLSDFDTFWHLANGRTMAQTHSIVNEEVFSYTANGTHFSNHAWLAQLIFYGVVAVTGLIGLTLFKGLLVFASMAFTYGTLRLYRTDILTAALCCIWATYASIYLLVERPNLFSLLLIAAVFHIFEGVRLGRYASRVRWLLPPIFLLWDVLHGSLYGIILLVAYTVGYLGSEAWRLHWSWADLSRQASLRSHLAVTGVVLLTVTFNPYGFVKYGFFTAFWGDNLMVSLAGEFLPTPLLPAFIPFWITLGVAALALLPAARHRDLLGFVTLLPFAYLAVRYSRATAVFMLLAMPVIAAQCVPLVTTILRQRGWQKRVHYLGLAVLVAVTLYSVDYKFLAPQHVNSFGWGVNPDFQPAAALKFIEANHIDGNLFNSGELGGYLAYAAPQRRIFLYNHHTVFNTLLESLRAPWALQRWDINYALLGYNWQRYAHLFPMEDWAPVYFESATLVMVRRSPQNARLIGENEIQYFSPRRTGEQNRQLARDPQVYPKLAQEIAAYLRYRTDREIADAFAEIILMPHPQLDRDRRLVFVGDALAGNPDNDFLRQALVTLRAAQAQGRRSDFEVQAYLSSDPKIPRAILRPIELPMERSRLFPTVPSSS